MGILNALLPTASGITAGDLQQATAKTQTGPSQNQVVTNAVVSGAVVVHLTTASPNRAASHGEGRQTDASFEKQQSAKRDVSKKKEEEKNVSGSSVNVSA